MACAPFKTTEQRDTVDARKLDVLAMVAIGRQTAEDEITHLRTKLDAAQRRLEKLERARQRIAEVMNKATILSRAFKRIGQREIALEAQIQRLHLERRVMEWTIDVPRHHVES